MILLATSQAVRRAFHLGVMKTTPAVPSDQWFRFWRIDIRYIDRRGEVALFTNHDTLYTFVADASEFRDLRDLSVYFMTRYAKLFRKRFGYDGVIEEQIAIHRAGDRSDVAVMNYFFQTIEFYGPSLSYDQLERRLNETPIITRDLVPAESLCARLKST